MIAKHRVQFVYTDGSSMSFLYLVRFEQLKGASDEHPRSYDRLIKFLDDHIKGYPNDLTWAMAQSAFWVHLKRAQPVTKPDEYDTFRDCAIDLAKALATAAATR